MNDPDTIGLTHRGTLRFGLFPSFFYSKRVDGEPFGIAIEIARALAAKIGAALVFHECPYPPDVVHALKEGTCHVALLGVDQTRAAEVDFSQPCMRADFSFLVPPASPIHTIADVGTPGIHIAIVRQHAMDTALKGKLAQGSRIYASTPDDAFELLRRGKADVLAGIRPGLLNYKAQLPGSRVLVERYGTNILALAVAKGDPQRSALIRNFVAEIVNSNFLQRALTKTGLEGVDLVR
jgi:polar amino acid transport system substrate-binding protein